MTVETQVSVYTQVFVPRDYDVFGELDVDHHSIAATCRRSRPTIRWAASTLRKVLHVRNEFVHSIKYLA
jgi:hypothetical protein